MVQALGPGPSFPKREPGAEPGRRCRREEEGGDGKPDSGRPVRRLPPPPVRLPPTRLSSCRAHGRPLGLGPALLAGPGWWGVGLPGLAREEEVQTARTSRAPPFPLSPKRWGLGRARRCKNRADNCNGSGFRSVGVNVGIRICGVEFPKESGFKDTLHGGSC